MAARIPPSQSSEQYEEDEEATEHVGEIKDASTQQLLTYVEKSDAMMAVQTWLDRSPPPYEQVVKEEEETTNKEEEKGGGRFYRVKVTGACLCKLSILIYLLACVLVSALYVAIYGPNELYTSPEVAIPHPNRPTMPRVPPLQFYDRPYTEWMAQRWTYAHEPFSDWPSLPVNLTSIHHVSTGVVNGRPVTWLFSSDTLLCAEGLGSDHVTFRNISGSLELPVDEEGFIAPGIDDGIWVVTNMNITLLDCSTSARDYCDIRSQWLPLPENATVLSATVSLSDNRLWLGTTAGLFVLDPSHQKREEDNDVEKAPPTVGEAEEEQNEEESEEEDSLTQIGIVSGSVQTMAWRSSLIGETGWGLNSQAFLLSTNSCENQQNVSYSSSNNVYISNSVRDKFGLLVVTTAERIYFYDGFVWWFEWVSVWEEKIRGVVDSPVISLTFVPSGELFIGTNVSLNILHINYTFTRIGSLQSLPYHPVSSLYYSPTDVKYPEPTEKPSSDIVSSFGVVWVGTSKGYAVFDIKSSRFTSYHYGPRWHPGEEVRGISAAGEDTVVVLTDKGMAIIWPELWTLKKKASYYQKMMERHRRDPGLVADCNLSNYSITSCSPLSSDNDGLWTSLLVAAEAFRYKVTGDAQARSNAWNLFQGMKFLSEVTGIDGLPARSVLPINQSVTDASQWHNSTTKPDWKWKGDTSSDEIVGHMFAYPIVYDLVAESEEEKKEVSSTLNNIISYIHSNHYHLIDVTNSSTRWGVWTPKQLNLNQSWSDERGLNSLQILSHLLSAYRITSDDIYWQAWMELTNSSTNGDYPNHYALNMINQRITFPGDINYSDDELAFLPYFVYCHTLKQLTQQQIVTPLIGLDQMWQLPLLSLSRTWSIVRTQKSALWTAIYGYCTRQKDPQLINDVAWSLRKWPLELVQWRTHNSHRLDVCQNPEQDRYFYSHTQSVHVLPANERGQLRWNMSPFELDSEGHGRETDPGAWLLSYWMACWTKLL